MPCAFDGAEALRRIDLQERSALASTPFLVDHARAVAAIGAGRYEAALDSAQRSSESHPQGTFSWALVELVEAAARCGQHERAATALEQLVDRTRLASTEWALGLEARSAALVEDDPAVAETRYREAIDRLDRARTCPDLARAHLVYGEWLRREHRRLDAREQLRTAHELFSGIGMPGFAERARRELGRNRRNGTQAHGRHARRSDRQESQIAQLASEGLTNPEIGAKLFLSPRTIEYHLRRVYPKLGISSRKELRTVLQASYRLRTRGQTRDLDGGDV